MTEYRATNAGYELAEFMCAKNIPTQKAEIAKALRYWPFVYKTFAVIATFHVEVTVIT